MSPAVISITIVAYFIILFTISYIAGRKADNEGFFVGNRKSAWYIVAFAMIGSTISGVTFVAVPAFAGPRIPHLRPQTRNRMECQYVTQRQSPLCNSVKCKKRSRSDKYLKQPAGTRWARNSSPGRFLLGKFKAKAAENERKTATVQK